MMLRYRRLRAEQVTTPCCLSVRQSVDLVGDRPEPRQPILVVERNATVHLADIGGAVKIVGIREVPVEAPGQQGADGRLAGAGHTHDDEDQGQNSGTPDGLDRLRTIPQPAPPGAQRWQECASDADLASIVRSLIGAKRGVRFVSATIAAATSLSRSLREWRHRTASRARAYGRNRP
jgi:hypothetical protein